MPLLERAVLKKRKLESQRTKQVSPQVAEEVAAIISEKKRASGYQFSKDKFTFR